ncbi:MAG: hypothetical protein R3C51_01400 [Parvularculaceae bacterium]
MQTENGNKYALRALKDKRATLAGEIAQLKNKLAWAESQLKHLDATIGIFEPGCDPDAIPNKRPKKRVKLFRQGELGRMILDALRTADGPMRTQDVVSAVLIAMGHDETARTALAPRVRTNLQYLVNKAGTVAKIGGGRNARWKLAAPS